MEIIKESTKTYLSWLLIHIEIIEIDKTDENMNISCLFFLQAAALPKGAKVEIEAIAMVGEIIDENL